MARVTLVLQYFILSAFLIFFFFNFQFSSREHTYDTGEKNRGYLCSICLYLQLINYLTIRTLNAKVISIFMANLPNLSTDEDKSCLPKKLFSTRSIIDCVEHCKNSSLIVAENDRNTGKPAIRPWITYRRMYKNKRYTSMYETFFSQVQNQPEINVKPLSYGKTLSRFLATILGEGGECLKKYRLFITTTGYMRDDAYVN